MQFRIQLIALFIVGIIANAQSQSCGYGFSKTITIDHEKVSGYGPLLDFPVLVSLTDNDLRTVANGGNVTNANGYDIVFVDAGSGQQLAHQIERYTAASGTYQAWVRVPVLYADFDTQIRMLYGNDQVTANPSTTETWDDNYQAVWHLHNAVTDGTSFANDGTNTSTTSAGGKIANARSFNGSTQYVSRTDASWNGDVPALSSGSPDDFTLSGWINVDNLNVRQPLLSKQGSGAGNDRGFVFMMEDNNELKIELFKNNNSATRTEVYSSTTLSTNTWYYMVATYEYVTDGTSICKVYLNGVEEGSTTTALGPIFTNSRDVEIGRYYWNGSTNYWMDGEIDEVRISNSVRSAAWVATEYENQNSPSTFYSVGAEVAGTVAPIVPVCNSGFKKTITIDNADVAGSSAHTDFPVLVSFTDNDLRTTANGGNVENANGWDIVFTDENLVPLDHQIETYVATSGRLVAWVKIPSLPTNVAYTFFMLYGNPDVYTDPSTPCTWEDYAAVWHLHDDFLDATINDEDGTNNGSTDNTSSKIADGQSFDGGDFIELTSFPNFTTDFTISGWIRTTDNTESGQRIFCDDENNSGGYALSLGDPGTGRIRFYSRGMNTVSLDGSNVISNNTWYYVAGVVDRTNQDRFIYVNGVQNAVDLTDGGTWGTDNGDASIGGETAAGETGNRFEGLLDEIRISSVARSVSWLLTEYNNQNNPAGFYTVGSEQALAVTTIQNGLWNQIATWGGGVVPSDGANVVIRHNVDVTDRDVIICNLTVESAANVASSFEVNNGNRAVVLENTYLKGNGTGSVALSTNASASTIQIKKDLIISQDPSSGTMTVGVDNAGDSIHVLRNWVASHEGGGFFEVTTNNATAVLQVDGNASFFMNDDTNEDDLEFDLNAGNMNVGGFLSVRRDNGFNDVRFDLDGGNLMADSLYMGTFNTSGSDDIEFDIDGTSEINVTRGMFVDMDAGDDVDIFLNTNNGSSAELNIGGDLVILKKGGDNLSITTGAANSEINVGGKYEIVSTGGGLTTFLMTNGSLNVTDSLIFRQLDGGEQFFFDVNNNSTISTGPFFAILDNNTNQELLIDMDNASTWGVTGDVVLTLNDGNDLEFHMGQNSVGSTASLTVSGDVLLDHNPSAGGDDIQFIVSDDAVVDVGGDFTMDTDGASGAGNFYTQLNGNADLNVVGDIVFTGANGSGEIRLEMNNTTDLTIGGNFVRDASPNDYGLLQSNATTTRITYNGTSAQIFADDDGAGTDGIEYERVVINNSSGTIPQLTMEDDVTLTNEITFTDGVLATTATELLTLADNAVSNGGNAGSYVSGPLRKIGNDDFVFPIGKNGTWARMEVSDFTGALATDEFTAEYFDTPHSESFYGPANYAGNTGGLYNTSTLEYWNLSRTGSGQPVVSLYWESDAASVITDTGDLVVARYAGANTWVNEGGFVTGVLAAGKVSSNGTVNAFGPFTFGSVSAIVNVLPIDLLSFSANAQPHHVDLIWQTATEVNNDYFTIERSKDGLVYEPLFDVAGAGNSNTALSYEAQDMHPLSGLAYYRLKQTDFNGQESTSSVQWVYYGNNPVPLVLYPNPAQNHINSNLPLTGRLTDATGRTVLSFEQVTGFAVDHLADGVYYLHASGLPVQSVVIRK